MSAAVPAGAAPFHVPFWSRGDLNATSGFFINMLVNVLVLTGLSIGVVQIPADQVTSILLPALGLQLLFGNFYYFYLARKLARRQGRTDVTAMPYGPSVPPMFIVTFVIMLPIFLTTNDPIKAWSAGIAWAFIIGLIILAGAFFGPTVRKYTPRAAMLGMLAGIALTFISMRPAAIMWEAAWIAIPVLAIIIAGFFANVRLPGNIPIGLAALLVGTAIGWMGGFMEGGNVSQAAKDIAIGLPGLEFDKLLDGMKELSPLLATAIPLGIFNVSEVMSNVESASAAGDDYNLRHVLLADGTGAVAGSMMGCPFPPAVYIGQPGWKKAGGRISYSLVTGIAIFALCILGMFPLLAALLPLPAIVPVLLFIGLVIGTQAFSAVPRAHYPAILLAVVPNIAAWGSGLVDNALVAAGTSAEKVGAASLNGAGVITEGLHTLGQGAVLAGLVLGAFAVFLIDRRFVHAAITCGAGAVLTLVGLMHGEKVTWFDSQPKVALGYAFGAIVCIGFAAMRLPERERDPTDPNDVPDDEFVEGAIPDPEELPVPTKKVAVPA